MEYLRGLWSVAPCFGKIFIFFQYVTYCVTTCRHGKLMGDDHQACPPLASPCDILYTPLFLDTIELAQFSKLLNLSSH